LDGRHLEWRNEAAWCRLDKDLHAGLITLREPSVAALDEQSAICPPGSLFHREPTPIRRDRTSWAMRKRSALDKANIVFLLGRNKPHYDLLSQLHERVKIETDAEQVATLRINVSVPRTAGSRSYMQRQRWFTNR
jgi:hypothetical protein